jgi:formate dehydrogenase subunit gamma
MASAARSSTEGTLPRFTRTVRVVHWSVAVLMFVCVLTAAIMYNGRLAITVGNRRLVELLHVYCGLALPVPILVGLVSRALRDDLHRLNRFTRTDWHWLRSRTRRDGTIRVGKFNAGQKLNAAVSAGAIGVLLGTGVLMFYTGLVRLSWRSGATFVHDWFALGIGLLILGHIGYAISDLGARQGMWRGRVSRGWAMREHEAWVQELDDASPGDEHPVLTLDDDPVPTHDTA